MDATLVKVLFSLFGLYSGVMSWLFRTAWGDIQQLKKELMEMNTNCAKCQIGTIESIRSLIDERFDRVEELVERKVQAGLEAGFTKMELAWINDGRIPTKGAQQK